MPRKPRFAPPGFYLHITQRGNYRQTTFFSDNDRHTFLNLLVRNAQLTHSDILAFCLMPNHYHLLARGNEPNSISNFMRNLNGQYSSYLHGRLVRTGRLWQSRFYACVLQHSHLLSALRYVELNPVRALLTTNPALYPWSSAPFHTGLKPTPPWLDNATFQLLATPADWPNILATSQSLLEQNQIRNATRNESALATDPAFPASVALQNDDFILDRFRLGGPYPHLDENGKPVVRQ
jgi:putative transposase